MNNWKLFFVIIYILHVDSTHLVGQFSLDDFFKFLVKFGFEKTEKHSQKYTDTDSYGYVYGNITSNIKFAYPISFAVLDKLNFLEYYGNRHIFEKETACQKMLENVQKTAFNSICNPKESGDYLRNIPCLKNDLCEDEDRLDNVVHGSQFTFVISNPNKPRFWYVSMVACYRNTTSCSWHYYDYQKFHPHLKNAPVINYDIKLVNGNPNRHQLTFFNPLLFHFSFEHQNSLEIYLMLFIIYLVMVPLQIYAVRLQKHPVTKLFTISLLFEFVSVCLLLTHTIRYSIDGIGFDNAATTGDIFDVLSRTSFMLILLLLAKGWAVTRVQISVTSWILLMVIWIPYLAVHILLYIWNKIEVDIISDIDEYQTWPGYIVLVCRSMMMLWFLWELRITMKHEFSSQKLDFLLHFGASSLVWFIYLPIVAIIAANVSPLWRYKLLLGITNSADCLAYCVMMGLLWPHRAGQYLLLIGSNYAGDELDEFNEAPHVHREAESIRHSNDDYTAQGSISNDTTNYDDDYLDEINNDEIETLVLSTDDLLISNNFHSVSDKANDSKNVYT